MAVSNGWTPCGNPSNSCDTRGESILHVDHLVTCTAHRFNELRIDAFYFTQLLFLARRLHVSVSGRENTETVATGRRELTFNNDHTSSISPAVQPKDDSL
jgi:hypothetical protein